MHVHVAVKKSCSSGTYGISDGAEAGFRSGVNPFRYIQL